MTIAKIAALNNPIDTGLTNAVASSLFDRLGESIYAVVRLTVTERTQPSDEDKDRSVKLAIADVEPATNIIIQRHMSDLPVSLGQVRDPQPTLDTFTSSVDSIIDKLDVTADDTGVTFTARGKAGV